MEILETVLFLSWFLIMVINNWGDLAMAKIIFIAILGAIPFFVIGFVFWGDKLK